MLIPKRPLGVAAEFTYPLAQAAFFDGYTTSYTSRNFNSGSNDTSESTKTYSFWVKRNRVGVQDDILKTYYNGTQNGTIGFNSSDQLWIYHNFNGTVAQFISTAKFVDVGEWYHIVFRVDQSNATAADRWTVWVNGTEVTNWATETNPGLYSTTLKHWGFMKDSSFRSWTVYVGGGSNAHCTLAEVICVDGQALDQTSFGQSHPVTDVWEPIEYTGTYGTNGWHMTFADSSSFGDDTSGNANDFTDSGLGTDHQIVDTPTDNFCTLTDLDAHGLTYILHGGTYANRAGGSGNYSVRGTHMVKGGKWYFEIEAESIGGSIGSAGCAGIGAVENELQNTYYSHTDEVYGFFFSSGNWYKAVNGVYTQFTDNLAVGVATGDKMCIAVDLDNGDMWVRKNNGSWVGSGDPALGTNPSISGIDTDRWFAPFVTTYNSSGITFIMLQANFGQKGGLSYTAPSGFQEIKSQNLSKPDITDPTLFYGALAWAGDGVDDRSITGLNFQPDIVWWKVRANTNWHRLCDSVRGATEYIFPNDSSVETTDTNECQAFESGGIQIGTDVAINSATEDYTAWCWKEGVTPGVDIVTYTGNGANRTIAHSLGVTPEMIIIKNRDLAWPWAVYHHHLAATEYLGLDVNSGKSSDATMWNSTAPTASVFSLGTHNRVNANADECVAYVFAGVPGFSKFGSYGGNGSTNGPYVHCGFKPAIIIIKRTDTTGTWSLYDNYLEPINDGTQQEEIYIDVAQANASTMGIHITSNGFKITDTDAWKNNASGTYVFAAFAEAPFNHLYARAV